MELELRQLRYFLSAAKHLSFTRAAEECCIVQSAMSQQIRALEREWGVTLFDRTKHGLRLTPEGRTAAQEAQRMLDQAESMQDTIRQARTGAYSVLRVGCQGNLLREALPRALSGLRSRYPELSAVVHGGLMQTLLPELREGHLDCAVAVRGRTMEKLDWLNVQPLGEETIRAMLPAQSPLAAQNTVSLQDLAGETLILYATTPWEDMPVPPLDLSERRVRVESQSDIETLVAAGYGVSFCAASAARPHPGIAYREVEDLPKFESCLIWRHGVPGEERVRTFASLLMMSLSETNGVF